MAVTLPRLGTAALVIAGLALSACAKEVEWVPPTQGAARQDAPAARSEAPQKKTAEAHPDKRPVTPRTGKAHTAPEKAQRAPRGQRIASVPPKADIWSVPTLRPSRDFSAGRATSFARAVRLPEHPYTNSDLHRNFLSIALRAEAADDTDGAGEIAIAKWDAPLRYKLHAATPADYVQVANVVARLRLLTGLDIRPAEAEEQTNMELWFVSKQQRSGIVGYLSGEKAIGPQVARLILRWRDTEAEKCLGLMATDPRRSSILNSVILIKDELPKRIRDACIVEEIVQSLGLMNDDSRARPSIFNDDQQYLDLTTHDEYLLRILYDRRIRPGMTRRDVAPMLPMIISDLRRGRET